MPTYKEILNYVSQNGVWADSSIQLAERSAVEDAQECLDDIYKATNELFLSRARSLCRIVSMTIGGIYFTSCYKKESDNNLLCSNLALHEIYLVTEYFDGIRKGRDGYTDTFSELSELWLMSFACNRFDLVKHCYPTVIEGLKNGMLSKSLPRSRRPQKLGVLAIEMMARDHEQTIDWDETGIPVDPFYQRFCDEALLSTDNNLVRDWLVGLCDKHLEWTDNRDPRYENNYITGYEIEREELLVWPFEYQAVKNYRTRHGLTTPDIEHPLLTSPMAMEHIPDFKSWQRWDWFDPLLDFVAQNKPELAFLKTLFNE